MCMNLPKSVNVKKKKEQQLEALNNTTYSAAYSGLSEIYRKKQRRAESKCDQNAQKILSCGQITKTSLYMGKRD